MPVLQPGPVQSIRVEVKGCKPVLTAQHLRMTCPTWKVHRGYMDVQRVSLSAARDCIPSGPPMIRHLQKTLGLASPSVRSPHIVDISLNGSGPETNLPVFWRSAHVDMWTWTWGSEHVFIELMSALKPQKVKVVMLFAWLHVGHVRPGSGHVILLPLLLLCHT